MNVRLNRGLSKDPKRRKTLALIRHPEFQQSLGEGFKALEVLGRSSERISVAVYSGVLIWAERLGIRVSGLGV